MAEMKMIFRILLLINLISCVSENFEVNVTSYQVKENHNITLEWTFTNKPEISTSSVKILCNLILHQQMLVLFHLHEGVEVSESQDQQFSGRVQFDKDVLREGQFRLHLSRLRTEDSGLYLCEVNTDDSNSIKEWKLNVTAARHPEPPFLSPEPASRVRIGLYIGLGLTAAVTLCFALRLCFTKSTVKTENLSMS